MTPANRPPAVLRKGTLAARVAAAASPAELRAMAARLPAKRRWLLLAEHARLFDTTLVDILVMVPECRPLLAANPHLAGRHLQRLVLWALRESASNGREEADMPYGVLLALAESGRLARFGWALHALVRRYVRATSYATAMSGSHRMVPRVILGCPELPEDVLDAFDAKLVRCGTAGDTRRVDIARHPSATATVWRAALKRQPPPYLVHAIARLEAAMADREIRLMLGADF